MGRESEPAKRAPTPCTVSQGQGPHVRGRPVRPPRRARRAPCGHARVHVRLCGSEGAPQSLGGWERDYARAQHHLPEASTLALKASIAARGSQVGVTYACRPRSCGPPQRRRGRRGPRPQCRRSRGSPRHGIARGRRGSLRAPSPGSSGPPGRRPLPARPVSVSRPACRACEGP